MTYRWLKGYIARLPRQEGSFLTEVGVAEAAGTSRTPVREALLRLQAEGVVQIVPKKGAFVPPISDSEVQAVMQARGLVEDWCVRQVAPVAGGLADELDRLVSEQESVSEDPVAFIDCDRAFHRTIVRRAGNPVLADFYESLRERQVRMGLHAVAAAEDRVRTVLDEHAAIVAAIRTGEADRAAHAVGTHLASTLATLNLPAIVDWVPPAGEFGSGVDS
ncbi:GntR family transcriptional regulator [Salinifilum aidingensis]